MAVSTPITADEAKDWLAAFRTAWVDRDAARAAMLFTPEASYRESRFLPPLMGREAVRRFWQTSVVAGQRDVNVTCELFAVSGAMAVAHIAAHFLWLPASGMTEIDGVAQIALAREADGVMRASAFEAWLERRVH